MNRMIEGVIIIIISLIILLGAISTLRKLKKIDGNGEKTEGVIFDTESTNTTVGDATITYPIVRFTTSNQEWITQKSSVSIIPGFYKKGDKVVIVYNRSSPTNFFIKSSATYTVIAILISAAIALIVIGGYILINSVHF